MTERYLTIREVSKIIGVTPLTLRNWDKKGQLRAYRNPLNNYRTYRYADIADFIVEIKKSSGPEIMARKIPVILEEGMPREAIAPEVETL